MQTKEFEKVVFILRAQPYHSEHERIILKALELSKNVVVILGSSFRARNIKNPFSFQERKEMILQSKSFSEEQKERMEIVPMRDYIYNEDLWIKAIQDTVKDTPIFNEAGKKNIGIIGHFKDRSSYYIKLFPKWEIISIKKEKNLDATKIREAFFSLPDFHGDREKYQDLHQLFSQVPDSTWNFIKDFPAIHKERYLSLMEEYQHYKEYGKAWDKAPYKPIFVTTDAVVTCRGYVLMVKRKFNPGKGLWALPGGFLDPEQPILESCVRELKEETCISLHPSVLKGNIKEMKTFDHPDRSLRGRTITHAGYFPLDFPELPIVKGADDAEHAGWVSFSDLRSMEEEIFEDHLDIINYFTGA